METYGVKSFCPERLELGEGMLWDDRNRHALWVDIPNGKIYEADEDGRLLRVVQTPDLATTVALGEDGALISTGKRHVYRIDRASGEARALCELPVPEDQRLNDGKCGPGGRLIVGAMALGGGPAAARLFSVSPDGSAQTLLTDLGCSNGIGFSPDGRTAYHIDTPLKKVHRYDFDPATGLIANRRVAVDTSAFEGFPDGMTTDNEGLLYVAMWGGGCVLCFDPKNGQTLKRIELPARLVTSCAFGGPDLGTLYITTASQNGERGNPDAGRTYQVQVNACGMKTYRFG